MAQESLNIVNLTGKLVEIAARTGTTKKGIPWIGGTLRIETAEDNIIPVSFWAQETTAAGKENGMYKSFGTVIEEFKTIQQYGREEADTIKLESGRLEENIFFPTEDRMIRGFRVSGSFFKRDNNATSPKNEFVTTGEILSVVEEVKRQGGDEVPTGSVIIQLLVVGWGDRPNVVDFVVDDPAGVEYVKSTFSENMEVKLGGEIIVDETHEIISEPVAFGEPLERVSSKVERKLVVKSVTAPVPTTLSSEERTKLMAVREAEIGQKKIESTNKNKGKVGASSGAKGDFTL